MTTIRLRADTRALVGHVRARVSGSDARLAADDLLGVDHDYQGAVVAAALAEQHLLDTAAADDAVVDGSGRTPAAVLTDVERLTST